ncbi:hypothetical protein Adt_39575 [Abeliophyllum distichum]|uniref:Uncharacterized protein n=1 Tax=Abeliophyllum distichum TaxID=126358 RepID=A0ABD1Q5G1_9LAMI
MGTPECHVAITKLDDEQEVQQHDKCDIRSNVERDVNIATEDETTRVQDQTTYDGKTGLEPQVDQTTNYVMTRVQDEHCHEHAAPVKVTKNIDFNWDEPIVNKSDEGDFN